MKAAEKTSFVLYTYLPSLPYYFEQTDIIEVNKDEKTNRIDIEQAVEIACKKNYCTPDEIKIINVFESKEELDSYLAQHDLRYLA